MTKAQVTKSIKISAVNAWNKLSSFRGIEDYSPIERSETFGHGAGATRTCYMPDGAVINEVLDKVENNKMEMQYSITDGPFPVKDYVSTINIDATDTDSCVITWSCDFESSEEVKQDMIDLFEGFYSVIIDSMEQLKNN